MKYFSYFFFGLILLVITSCDKIENDSGAYRPEPPYLVGSYYFYDSLDFLINSNVSEEISYNAIELLIKYTNDDVHNWDSITNKDVSLAIRPEIWGEFREIFGDTLYDDLIRGIVQHAIIDTIESINIYSNTNYDDEHLAGTLLNDILTISCTTAEPLTEPNYIENKPLTEFNTEGHYLVSLEEISLKLTKAPEQTSSHTFRLGYKTTGGKVIEKSCLDAVTIIGEN